MKRSLFCMALAVASGLVWGSERVPLWPADKIPNFQPHQIGAMTDEAGKQDFVPDQHRMPYLEWFEPPAQPNGACLILISGGSYQNCCDVWLIKMWREKFTAEGFQCVNFVYRTPRPKGAPIYRSAWQDGQRAVRLVRADAKKRGYNPERIGTMSMSAGSHLATLLATSALTPAYSPLDALDQIPCHINWAITGAIAYGVTDGYGIPNTREGQAVDAFVDPAFKFDAKTAPMCMFHGGCDVYSPNASTLVYRELRKRGVPAELHLFADRNHGFWGRDGLGSRAAGYDNWFITAKGFLRQMNFDGKLGPEVPQTSHCSATYTAKVESQKLWPSLAATPNRCENQTYEPYLEWYTPKELKTKAIQIILPGGGYNFCNVPGEGVPTAQQFNQRGMTAVIMKYRTPRPTHGLAKHLTAWQDVQRAVRIVRAGAELRGLDPNRIGIMGFSAGGHLTIMSATSSRHRSYWPIDEIDNLPCKVQWAFPIYPAYALTDGADCTNKNRGNTDDAVLVPEFSFDLDTPPMCFMHGDADPYAAMNSVKCWEKLRLMGIQSDLHTLALRGHCFQFKAAPDTVSYSWVDRLWEFLNHKKLVNDVQVSVFAGTLVQVANEKHITWAESGKLLRQAGVTGFDGCYTDDNLPKYCAAGLRPINFYGFMHFLSADNGAAESKKFIETAMAYHVPRIMVVPDDFKPGEDEEAQFVKILSGLKYLLTLAQAQGITVTVEDFGGVKNPCSHQKYLQRFLTEIPELCFALDSGNMYYASRGEDIYAFAQQFASRIRHVHLKDQTVADPHKYATLGAGAVPNEKLVKFVNGRGYDSWYCLENPMGPDTLADVQKQVQVLRQWCGR